VQVLVLNPFYHRLLSFRKFEAGRLTLQECLLVFLEFGRDMDSCVPPRELSYVQFMAFLHLFGHFKSV